MREIVRHDYAVIGDAASKLLPNGFLPVEANLTRTGIFTYYEMDSDGSVRIQRQLRHPDEVFSDETMASLHGLPATNDHPPVNLLTTDNAKDFVVGWQADSPRRIKIDDAVTDSDDYIQTKIVFFDNKTIEQIQSGRKKEISLGYTCLLDETPGEYNGQKYDAVQRGIRYNHLSLVDKARGGPECRIIQDSQSSLNAICDGIPNIRTNEMNDQQITKDAEELKVLKDAHERLKAERDELSDKLKKAMFHDADAFHAAVKKRVALEFKAQQILGSKVSLSDSSEREIMEQVIKSVKPDLDLSERSDEYVAARFEITCEDHIKAPAPVKRTDSAIGKAIVDGSGDNSWQNVYANARAKMLENARNAYKV